MQPQFSFDIKVSWEYRYFNQYYKLNKLFIKLHYLIEIRAHKATLMKFQITVSCPSQLRNSWQTP